MPRDPGFDAGDEESSVLLGESDRRAEWPGRRGREGLDAEDDGML